MLTVVGPAGDRGGLALRGVFVGDDEECFKLASKLSLEVNFNLVPRPIEKVYIPAWSRHEPFTLANHIEFII